MLTLNPKTNVLRRGRRGEDTDRKGEDNRTMEVDIGMMWLQIKECWKPLEEREARKDSSLEPLEGAWPTDTFILGFWPLDFLLF